MHNSAWRMPGFGTVDATCSFQINSLPADVHGIPSGNRDHVGRAYGSTIHRDWKQGTMFMAIASMRGPVDPIEFFVVHCLTFENAFCPALQDPSRLHQAATHAMIGSNRTDVTHNEAQKPIKWTGRFLFVARVKNGLLVLGKVHNSAPRASSAMQASPRRIGTHPVNAVIRSLMGGVHALSSH